MHSTDRAQKKFIGAVEDEWQLYSDRFEDYTVGPPIGFGASSTVYRAVFQPVGSSAPPVPCALKVLDLDRLPQGSLRLLQSETQLMSLSKHPNVLRVRGSWMDGHKLYIALRLMNAGSAADVMQYGWPGGMEEEVVRCILKQALQGLNYLHINGFIHRDIKAANLLIDDDGTVLLGDLGVAAQLQDEDHSLSKDKDTPRPERSVVFDPAAVGTPRRPRVGKRRSFVGTPCWMAPELISGKHYDSSADIWSFGITALELAQGRAPRSRESPHTVLLHTVQEAPPTLDRDGGVHKYSRTFKEVVESCLVKDPSARPTAEQLLQTPFFKNSKRKSYLVGTILSGLPPLAQRLERRRQPSLLLHGTIDSWDFNATLTSPSPAPSVFRRSRQASVDVDDSGVFKVDEALREAETGEEMDSDPPSPSAPPSFAEPDNESTSSSPASSSMPTTPQRSRSPSPVQEQAKPVTPAVVVPSKADATPVPPRTRPSSFVPLPIHPTPVSSSPPTSSLWRKLRESTRRPDPPKRRSTFMGSVLNRRMPSAKADLP